MQGVAARKLAVEVLVRVEVDRAYANLALSSAFERGQLLPERDRAFATFLVQGVLRHRDELDKEISTVSKQPLDKLTPAVRNLLRLAIFQLRFAPDIPESAVVNTATEIGKKVGHEGIGKFVTGVLRAYLRSGAAKKDLVLTDGSAGGCHDNDAAVCADGETAAYLAQRYTAPEWLVERWLNTRGRETTKKLLEFSQSVPELIVRTCESGITVEALMNIFNSHGIKFRQGHLVPSCLIIEDRGKYKGPVDKLPGYNDGLFMVQDEAAAFPARVVNAKPGEVVVDLCAAPGGKSVQMAEMMDNKGRVIAVDLHANRLELVKQNRRRVGLTNIEAVVADGTTFKPDTPADKVLLDAPCTGTGVMNRRSDLRFKRESPDLAALVDLQRKLLTNAVEMLKPGGTLVYSTCSIESEENEQNINWLLAERKDIHLKSLEDFVPDSARSLFPAEELKRGWIQLLPTTHHVAGFFVARLQKD